MDNLEDIIWGAVLLIIGILIVTSGGDFVDGLKGI